MGFIRAGCRDLYRDFTRVGGTKMPDAKTMGRWGVAVDPAVVKFCFRGRRGDLVGIPHRAAVPVAAARCARSATR